MDVTTPPESRGLEPDDARTPDSAIVWRSSEPAGSTEVDLEAGDWDEPLWIDRIIDWLSDVGWRRIVTFLTVAGSMLLIFSVLHPTLIFRNTTPTGGDMGAHVWGPAYLRDNLLPKGRLSGWSPDWYAGFPAFQFYMVIPSLLIVLLNVGLGPVSAVAFVAGLALALRRIFLTEKLRRFRSLAVTVAAFGAVLAIGMPYGVAFKIVAVLGLVTMPLSAYLLGRLSGMPFPVPAVLAVSTLPFVFDRSFTILGGNIASTMAGEFAFSIALSTSLVYLGLMYRALATGKGRGLAALFFAIMALCHLLVAFVMIGVTVLMVLTYLSRTSLKTLALVGTVGGALTAFWVLPFYAKRIYVNDMGWNKMTDYESMLWTRAKLNPAETLRNSPPLKVVILIAVLGLLMSVLRRNRMGIVLAMSAAAVAVAFVALPDGGRLWNGRILPEYYLFLYLLAGVGVGEFARSLGEAFRSERLGEGTKLAAPAAAFACMWLVFGPALRILPGGGLDAKTGEYRWPKDLPLISTKDVSYVKGWAEWNFRGYEEKRGREDIGGYEEYYALNEMMRNVGAQHGCGRAMWEYSNKQEAYGTTMALMLLPHWSDSCIPSMEGLYFEASSTTPFHFLNQAALSQAPSKAQSHIDYLPFDIDVGVKQLQLMGVRYYMAWTAEAVKAASAHPDLEEIAYGSAGQWRVFKVKDSELVSPLTHEPVVYSNVDEHQVQWLPPAVDFFNDPSQHNVLRAADGPAEWARYATCVPPETKEANAPPAPKGSTCLPPAKPLEPVTVSDIRWDDDEISFSVDKVGVPVLVKASYFPNWKVSGAKGPYRVTPNLMVVVPTGNDVRLHYGSIGIDYLANLVSIGGIAGLVLLFRRRPEEPTEPWFDLTHPFAMSGQLDDEGDEPTDGFALYGSFEAPGAATVEPDGAAVDDRPFESLAPSTEARPPDGG